MLQYAIRFIGDRELRVSMAGKTQTQRSAFFSGRNTMHNLNAYQQIEKIKALHWIRQSAIFLKPSLESDDHEEIEAAKQGYKDLLDSFYAEVSEYMPLSQYRAAERDFEYFLRLIDLALAYFIAGVEAEGQVQ